MSSAAVEPDGGPAAHGVQVTFDAVGEHAQRSMAAGATLVAERSENTNRWILLIDPEGDESCLQ
ncbi:MAG TPA: VOC family protein [Jatrophihabitans sp.]|uniref:VOC family protein n=1 Tax=Jatrophihabitans sp. TaxID=1932789 RepID=UPI002EF35F79